MLEEVQVGGVLAEHAEHWKAPEIVEPALKYMALTFRKAFNSNNKRDILQRLKEAIHNMRPVIEGQTRVNAEAVKWYLSLNMNLCKSTSPAVKTDPTVTFRRFEIIRCSNVPDFVKDTFHYDYNEVLSKNGDEVSFLPSEYNYKDNNIKDDSVDIDPVKMLDKIR